MRQRGYYPDVRRLFFQTSSGKTAARFMETCSFSFISETPCGPNGNSSPESKWLPIRSCVGSILSHLRATHIGVSTFRFEYDLIKARSGYFEETEAIDDHIICPNHRFHLGKGFRRRKVCMSKEPLSNCCNKHQASDTTVSLIQSQQIYKQYGILIPFGSGFCRQCRVALCNSLKDQVVPSDDTHETLQKSEKSENMRSASLTASSGEQFQEPPSETGFELYENTEYTLSQTSQGSVWTPSASQGSVWTPSASQGSVWTPSASQGSVWTPSASQGSVWTPSASQGSVRTPSASQGSVWTPSASQEDVNSRKRKALDSFLLTCGASPVKKTLTAEWRGCSERTKSDYIIKTTKILNEVLNVLVPGQETDVLQAIMKCNKQKEERLLNIISAAYIGCEDWGSQRQILSIVAHQVSYSELHALIPDLSRYKYGAARKHALSVGSGQKVPATEITHEGITTEQINHFLYFIMSPAIITDIPFGESNLKLSNGEIISVPKIILNSVRTRVVQQYFSYCEEINFEEKGSLSSYMRILHAIGPNVRKCMKGLDNYAADGAKAIESLQKIADLFGRLDKGKEWQDKMCKLLTSSKQYLKLEYKTHVVKESEVADHCCTFALSDGTKDYTSSCSHLHQNSCNQCEELDTVLECLMGVSKTITYDNDDQRDDTMYTISESVRAVHEWKKHILRSVNQDIARKSVLENLKEDEMLVERDWAMKFIPMQYRESQSNWFGKRGLNWHVSVATFKYRQALTMHTVIHIFDSAPQDAETSNAVLGNSLEIFHQINPCLTNAYIRSDNAGCFHGAASVCAMPFLSSIVQCKRMDFADPQGGKSICDRKAAHVKSYIRQYVNEGNDVQQWILKMH
ncbi:uncharacterized protein LOC134719312 [Mytilus trossulus]|uniref:uncharacterized protein LOC134719312 n=1 Tax=Mytilus trossulus TaxID=6551 RepID=UPI003007AC84